MSESYLTQDSLEYAVAVMNALRAVDDSHVGEKPYGTFYVSKVEFLFDGDPVGFYVAPEDSTYVLVTE